ncbi:response regulator transcription factor [Bacteroidota bacterium]
MKILIVDDSPILQDRLSTMIREETNFQIIGHALNIVLGKELVDTLNPDVVISDIRVPGGGGFELLKYIKDNHKKVRTIMITNYPYPQYKEKAEEMGAEHFLSKSDDIEQLIPILKTSHNHVKMNKEII